MMGTSLHTPKFNFSIIKCNHFYDKCQAAEKSGWANKILLGEINTYYSIYEVVFKIFFKKLSQTDIICYDFLICKYH